MRIGGANIFNNKANDYCFSTITFLQNSCELLSMLLYNLQLFFQAQ